jgi:tetratricopeptide (TPR) repeat protein
LIEAFFRGKDYEKAESLITQLLPQTKKRKHRSLILNYKGNIEMLKGNHETALKYYRKALEANPRNTTAKRNFQKAKKLIIMPK